MTSVGACDDKTGARLGQKLFVFDEDAIAQLVGRWQTRRVAPVALEEEAGDELFAENSLKTRIALLVAAALSRRTLSICAIFTWTGIVQWFSSDRMTGRLDVWNALALMASITLRNANLVVNV